ncbi:type III PLP-dependent enzyme [Arthrobacter cavernae]|uniref:Type III PLP-dependent enzyme n=1 Tax=Arthrobacter cavernae TaxID=2817681 RepID=A0A939KKG9_9MICC|nr:type III PLP-dependent enzyme [Arthrobacter cavernae]MBO1268814.1 type III PLP-dependent enzyme [Arthrobacter cavernae]
MSTTALSPSVPVTQAVLDAVHSAAAAGTLPAYVYDVGHLAKHLGTIQAGLAQAGPGLSLLHAVKANPDAGLLEVIARHVDALEVASGGELAHVRRLLPDVPLAFGGPGKTDEELVAALEAGVDRFHVESPRELHRLQRFASERGVVASVLLRCNLPLDDAEGDGAGAAGASGAAAGAALMMGGTPSPFGMDPDTADDAAASLPQLDAIRFVGIHAHLASGLGPGQCAEMAESILRWARDFADRHGMPLEEVNVGGGMSVDYARPDEAFDWDDYGRCMADVVARHAPVRVRIEPGRAVSAYSGWYATRVLDLKRSHGSWFAVCAGGTHHLRTPAAKGHSQPLAVVPLDAGREDTEVAGVPVTFVGQLCTPKDVLAREVSVESLAVGDLVVFGMAGAYAYNISHRDFLMHPAPRVIHVGG